MKVRTTILTSIVASLAVSVLIASVVFSILRGMNDEVALGRKYIEIINKTHALNLLISRYQAGSDRSLFRQIMTIHSSLHNLFGGMASSDASEGALIRQISTNNQELDYSLHRLVAHPYGDDGGIERERRNILISQLWMKTQFIFDDTYRLMDISQSRIETAQKKTVAYILALIIALMLINAAISLFSGRSIVRAEEALQEHREWLKVTLTSIGDAVIAADTAGQITFINPVATELTGWEENEARGQMIEEVFRIINEQTGKPAEDIVRRVLRDGQVVNLANHTALVTRDGREIPIEDSAAPIRNNTGDVAGVVIVFHDVTAKRIAQEAMELAHAQAVSEKNRLEAVMEALPVGVAILDARGGTVRSNATFDQIWGSPRPVASSIGDYAAYKAWWVDTGQPVQPEEWASARAVQRGETVIGQFIQIERFDGTRAFTLNSGVPIFGADGEIQGSAVAILDITERVKAEEALRQSEQEFRAIFEVSTVGLAQAEPLSGRFLRVNRKFCEITGYSAEELLTMTYADITHSEDRDRDVANVGKALDGDGTTWESEKRYLRKDGGVAWVHVSGTIMRDATGRPYRSSAGIRDITERKRAEETLRENETRSRLLSKTASLLLASDDPQGIVNELCSEVMAHLDCHTFFNFLVDERVGRLHLNACAGIPDDEARKIEWLDYGVAVCGCVARDGVRILAEDICNVPDPRTELVKSYGIQAYACHPLMAQGRLIGTLSFGTKTRGRFSPRDLDLMKTVTDQVAVAMERKRLIGELESARNRLEMRVRERTAELAKLNEDLKTEIVERRRSEEAVKSERKRLHEVLDMLPAYVVLLTPDYHVPFINRFFRERFGEAGGRRCHEWLFGRKEPCEICETYTVLRTNAPHHWEWTGPDGRNYDVSDFPFTDSDGSPLIMEVGVDITELRQIEMALRRSEAGLRKNVEMLQQIFDGISDPLIMLDRDGLAKMVNKAAMDYHGAGQAEDVLGKPCFRGLRGRETACAGCDYPFPSAERQALTFERKGLNDTRKVENVTIYPILSESGRRDAIIIKITDVTQAKLLERQMFHNEKLASLGLVTSGIAHEINNPNSFIHFNIPILRQYLEELMPIVDGYASLHPEFEVFHMSYGELREDVFKLLENMEHGSQRINKIVGVLKSFVQKRDTGELQKIDLKKLIDKVVTLCHAEMRHKVKSFEVLVPEDLPPILTDPEALEQVLLNLLINSIHACDKEDSWIRLKVARGSSGRDDFVIEVTDNGSGIEETITDKIFDPFFTTKTSTMGTGLGLYICHSHVQSLGGDIEVESIKGQGSTFRVLLPQTNKK